MESADRELIREMQKTNVQLRRLYLEHQDLENKLISLENRTYLTSPEQQELKQLKLRKLQGVEAIMRILNAHRGQTQDGASANEAQAA